MTHAHSILKRYAVWILACLCVIELFVVPSDVGRYSQTFDDYGLVGFLLLPSVLVFQVGYLVLVAFLVSAVFRAGLSGGFRVIAWLLGLAVTGYCLSLWGIHEASKAGEFGIGAAGFFGLFGFLPSAAFIYIVAPVIFLYGITKRCA